MQYFQHCLTCELLALSMIVIGLSIYGLVNYFKCKNRRWGCNPPDAKYIKNKNGHI